MFDDFIEDLRKAAKFGGAVATLKKLINRWDAVVAGVKKVKKINARGRCNSVIHGPRKYDNALTTAEAAKKSDPIHVLNAKTAARKLQETVKQFGNSVQPSCGFNWQ